MKKKAVIIISVSLLAVIIAVSKILFQTKENQLATFVITETGKFTSLDPLDGDSSQNLPVARMLYATPIEIFSDNTLGSRVLESFDYNKNSKTIEWVVKQGITYSDGSPITPEDVAFSVTRMAFTRKDFPLVKLIKGIQAWVDSKKGLSTLPEGIKIDGYHISIALTEDYPHPLFRFCLELFGIIPKRCVDPSTNKITCEKVPSSGYYLMKENNDKSLLFERRQDIEQVQGKLYPSEIRFLYREPSDLISDPSLRSESTVILSSESKLNKEQLKSIESSFEVGYTPAAWFTILQINPTVAPFTDTDCRREFANTFRRNYSNISNETIESSVFTKLVAGYKSHNELFESTPSLKKSCPEKFKGAKIPWQIEKSTPQSFVQAIQKTVQDLGMVLVSPEELSNRKVEVDHFIEGKSAFLYARTGFWALDPTGDIQMLFTPNLHKGLKHYWKDEKLQSMLHGLVKNGEVQKHNVDAVNEYLFQEAKFNVYSHIRRFYASTNKDLVHHLPIGITSPSPWHLFGAR